MASKPEQQVQSPPGETISELDLSSQNRLICASWDGSLCMWQITNEAGQSQPQAMTKLNAPALSCAFFTDGSKAFAGSADGCVKMWDVQSQAVTDLGKHQAAVKNVCWVPAVNMLVSGSWDKTLKWWDLRSPNPVANIPLKERCYSVATRGSTLVVATADKKISAFSLNNPATPSGDYDTNMSLETRCTDVFLERGGQPSALVFGTAEGRCGIRYFSPHNSKNDFTFKCHRSTGVGGFAYPVHSLSVHPQFGTFSTSGGDGISQFWDLDSKHRLKMLPKKNMPVTASRFSPDGRFFVHATGYDWCKGKVEYESIKNDLSRKPEIWIYPLSESDVKPKSSQRF